MSLILVAFSDMEAPAPIRKPLTVYYHMVSSDPHGAYIEGVVLIVDS